MEFGIKGRVHYNRPGTIEGDKSYRRNTIVHKCIEIYSRREIVPRSPKETFPVSNSRRVSIRRLETFLFNI